MNKLLVLLYLSLIVSCSLSKECSEADCDKSKIQGGQPDNYVCVPKDDDTCELKPLCTNAAKAEGEETLICSDFPAQHPGKICINNGEAACKEEYRCAKVPSLEGGQTCSSFKVSDNSKYLCEEASTTSENTCSKYVLSGATKVTYSCEDAAQGATLPCKETPFCSYVKSLETGEECTNFPLEEKNGDTVCIAKEGDDFVCQEKYLCDKVPAGTTEACTNFVLQGEEKYTHYCKSISDGEFACKSEKYSCNDLPKITNEEATIDCSTFLDTAKSETHVCIEDETSTTKQCKEIKLCSKVNAGDMTGVIDCSTSFHYDKENYRCRMNKEGNLCEQVYLCEKASTEEAAACSTFATTDSDHVCLDDGTTNKCKEEFYCSKVPKSKEIEEGFDCSKYTLSKENNDGEHICTKNLDSATYACREEYFCEKAKVGATDEECSKYPVSSANKDKNGCVKDKEKDQGCKEEQLCTEVANGENIDCSKYPVTQEKFNTHICKAISNPTETTTKACEEVARSEINCEEATKGESNAQCNGYKVSAANKKCIKNSGTGANPCTEKDKSECELKTTGATNDEACSSLAVEKTGEQTCIKNPSGENCMLVSFCKFGIPNSDGDCSQFALEDKTKKCKKKEGENKCEEVEEKTEPVEPGEGEKTEVPKEEKSDGAKTSDKDESSEAIKDASDTTASPATKTENENIGNLINVAYSLLLINYLVLLF